MTAPHGLRWAETIAATHEAAARLTDRLLGPRCGVCGERVFVRDQAGHDEREHPGETL